MINIIKDDLKRIQSSIKQLFTINNLIPTTVRKYLLPFLGPRSSSIVVKASAESLCNFWRRKLESEDSIELVSTSLDLTKRQFVCTKNWVMKQRILLWKRS